MKKLIFFSSLAFLLLLTIIIFLTSSDSENEGIAYSEEEEINITSAPIEVENEIIENDGRIPIPEKDEEGVIPIEIYFLKKEGGKCGSVFGVRRTVPVTKKAPRDSLIELFKGVSEKEEGDGYYTLIDEDVAVQGMSVQHGVAFVDVNDEIEEELEDDCEVKSVRAQIDKTLMQFSGINEVQLYIGGKDRNIFQP